MRKAHYEKFMKIAVEEAKLSLQKGNKGFGAVLVKNQRLIAKAHDTPFTDADPTAHAEMNAVKKALKKRQDLAGCTLISTHEPCPMCTGAVIWTRISEIVFGVTIKESRRCGRTMIDINSEEIIRKSPHDVKITGGILREECIKLYDEEIRKWVRELRNTGIAQWKRIEKRLLAKRIKWFQENESLLLRKLKGDDLEKAYQLLLLKIGIKRTEAPVIEKTGKKIVFHSKNRCPSLEACKILNIDPGKICRTIFERPTDRLVKKINPRLKFSRNYRRIRPFTDYCEEIITLED